MSKYCKAIISVPTFTIDNESPFTYDVGQAISETENQENRKTKTIIEPIVNQMTLNDDYQSYIYIANSSVYRNQFHQLNKDPIFDKNYYLQNVQ